MKRFCPAVASCLALLLCSLSQAQVMVTDSGVQTGIIGPGAPAHTVGLARHHQTIVMDTQSKPVLHDFRFVFFDYAGRKNEAAKADLRGRAPALVRELATFAFTDPSVARWPLPQKQAEIRQVLESVPADKEAPARYERWGRELAAQLKLLHSGSAGAIMAEANAARTIGQWERGLPELKLKALLDEI